MRPLYGNLTRPKHQTVAMVHTLPVESAMLNITEQAGIRNARRNGLRHIGLETIPAAAEAEETGAGQCERLAAHGFVYISAEETRAAGYRAIRR